MAGRYLKFHIVEYSQSKFPIKLLKSVQSSRSKNLLSLNKYFVLFAGSTRQIIQKSQSDAEETIENWRQADEQATREAHDTATVQCAELTDFGGRLRDQIRASDQAVSILVQKQFKRDLPTGTKKNSDYFFFFYVFQK